MSFYGLKTIVLCQNDNLIGHAANGKTFCKTITHGKYFANFGNPTISKCQAQYKREVDIKSWIFT